MTAAGDLPEAITLDVWYSLLYQTAPQRRAYERARAAAWVEPMVTAGTSPQAAAGGFRRMSRWAQARSDQGVACTIDDQLAWMKREVTPHLAASAVRTRLRQMTRDARFHTAPGAIAALDALRARGLRLALVSNVLYEEPRSMRSLLTRSGVSSRVDAIVLSSELGYGKPSPRPIREALGRIGVRPGRALHVGDQAVDIAAAWAAGVPALRYVGVRGHWPSAHARRLPPRWRAAPELPTWGALHRHLGRWAESARAAQPRPRLGSARRTALP